MEFAFFIKAESAEIAPGIPIPTESTSPKFFSNSDTTEIIPSIVP